jgi:hypothetical protein
VQSPQRIFFRKFSKHSPYFAIKIKIAKFRQWVRVTRLDLGRIQNKTLLSAYDSHHLMRIKAGDPRQCTYLRNLKRTNYASCYYFFSSYFNYSSFNIILLSLLLLLFSLLLLLFSHRSYSFPVAVTLLTWCCSFPWMK